MSAFYSVVSVDEEEEYCPHLHDILLSICSQPRHWTQCFYNRAIIIVQEIQIERRIDRQITTIIVIIFLLFCLSVRFSDELLQQEKL